MINGCGARRNLPRGNREPFGGRFRGTWLVVALTLGIGIWFGGLYPGANKSEESGASHRPQGGIAPASRPPENKTRVAEIRDDIVHPSSLRPMLAFPQTGAPNYPAISGPAQNLVSPGGGGQTSRADTPRQLVRGALPQAGTPRTHQPTEQLEHEGLRASTAARPIQNHGHQHPAVHRVLQPRFGKHMYPPSTPEPPLASQTGVPSFPRMVQPTSPLAGSAGTGAPNFPTMIQTAEVLTNSSPAQAAGGVHSEHIQLAGGEEPKQTAQKPETLPLPKTAQFQPFGPNRPRLPSLLGPGGNGGCDGKNPCFDSPSRASRPVPTKEQLKAFQDNIQGVVDPQNTLDLFVGRTRVVLLKNVPTRVQVADEEIAVANPLEPLNLAVLGRKVGTTVLNLWFDNPKDKANPIILSYLIRVFPDPLAKTRLDQIYDQLAKEINCAFPDSYVKLSLVGDKLVAKGEVKDIAEGFQILRILRANAPTEDDDQIPVDTLNVGAPPGDPTGLTNPPTLDDFLTFGGPNVVNLLRVAGEQQVMLKVTVAEVNRAAARSIGLNFSITNSDGVSVFQNLTGNIAGGGLPAAMGGLAGIAGGLSGNGPVNNLPTTLDNGQVSLAINALKNLSYARSLAEPNLTTMNGQTATFLAGGQFPVPVTTGVGIGALQGVSFVPFGVQLAFTPFITDRNRIRLVLSATVSARDLSSSASIGDSLVSGLNTRTFTSTVQLRDGETLAVAGLIQNNLGAESDRIPFIGDLPILTNLTGSNRTSSGEQELVVLVQPVLVRPLGRGKVPPLPGSDVFEPSDLEFYLLGRLESRRRYDYRTSAMTDYHRMQAYKRCERYYIFGPHGHARPDFVEGEGQFEGSAVDAGPGPSLFQEDMAPGHPNVVPQDIGPKGVPAEQLHRPNQFFQALPKGTQTLHTSQVMGPRTTVNSNWPHQSHRSNVVRTGVAQSPYWPHEMVDPRMGSRSPGEQVRGAAMWHPYADRLSSVQAPQKRRRPLVRLTRWLWGASD
ncbi:MAG: pilus assembly protein N-terminal domain-containing protein [Gemmataceae bacterium]